MFLSERKMQTWISKRFQHNKISLADIKLSRTKRQSSDNLIKRTLQYNKREGCPRGVMVKAMDCGIVVREFVLQSHYYVHFRANTLGKGMNLLILPAMG